MWSWILIGLGVITKVHGYANGYVTQSCESMSPQHVGRDGNFLPPQNTKPPFEVLYQHGRKGEPITVVLQSKQSTTFRGFMLEAREKGRVDNVHPVGKFISLDERTTQLLSCNGLSGKAVSQQNNQMKNLVRVNWTAQGEELNIIFRATFVESRATFWEQVDVDVTSPPDTTPPPTSTQPSTTASTEPSTTTSTEPSTTSTQPSTTASTEPSTTSRTTPPTKDDSSNKTFVQGAGVMTSDIVFEGLKTELPIVMMAFTNSPTHHLNKKLKISCCLLCAVAEISAMTLFCLGDSFKVTLVALTCVVMVFNLIQLIIIALPLGPSHELNEICDLAVKVCSVIQKNFAITVLFVVVMEIDDRNECWLLKIMIAYTVWIYLIVIWTFVFSACRKAILGRSQIGSSKTRGSWRQQRNKKKLSAAEVTVITASMILIVGTISFTFAVNFGLFSCM